MSGKGRPDMAAINSPGGPINILPWTVREDHTFCHRQSGDHFKWGPVKV